MTDDAALNPVAHVGPAQVINDYSFPGPNPVAHAVDTQQVADITKKLQSASRANEAKGIPLQGMSQQEAELLVKWAVDNTRQGMTDYMGDLTHRSLDGHCGVGQEFSAASLEVAGLKPHRLQVKDVVGAGNASASTGHAFTVVEIPVQTGPNTVEMKAFLVDPTARQFFKASNNDPTKVAPDQLDGGYRLTRTQEGRQIADSILKNGYVELTEPVAKAYLTALNGGREISASEGYRGQILKTQSQAWEWTPQEMAEMGLNLKPLTERTAGEKTVVEKASAEKRATEKAATEKAAAEKAAPREKEAVTPLLSPGSNLSEEQVQSVGSKAGWEHSTDQGEIRIGADKLTDREVKLLRDAGAHEVEVKGKTYLAVSDKQTVLFDGLSQHTEFEGSYESQGAPRPKPVAPAQGQQGPAAGNRVVPGSPAALELEQARDAILKQQAAAAPKAVTGAEPLVPPAAPGARKPPPAGPAIPKVSKAGAAAQAGSEAINIVTGVEDIQQGLEHGDKAKVAIGGSKVGVGSGGVIVTALQATGKVKIPAGVSGALGNANIAIMVADGVYQISLEEGATHKTERGVAVTTTALASIGAAHLTTAALGTAGITAAGGGLAAVATVAAPLVVAAAAGYVVAKQVETIIETRRVYEQEDQRFQADFKKYPNIAAIKNNAAVLERVEAMAKSEGLNYNAQNDKSKPPLLGKDGQLDFSNPETERLLSKAIQGEIAEKQAEIDNHTISPRATAVFANGRQVNKTTEAYNNAKSDIQILRAASEELEHGYGSVAIQRAEKRKEYDQKVGEQTRQLQEDIDRKPGNNTEPGLRAKFGMAKEEAQKLTQAADALDAQVSGLTGKKPEPVYIMLQDPQDKKVKQLLDANGKPVTAEAYLVKKEELIEEKQKRLDGLKASRDAAWNPDTKASIVASEAELLRLQTEAESVKSWTACERMRQTALEFQKYTEKTADIAKQTGVSYPSEDKTITQSKEYAHLDEAAQKFKAAVEQNEKNPSPENSKAVAETQIALAKAEREFFQSREMTIDVRKDAEKQYADAVVALAEAKAATQNTTLTDQDKSQIRSKAADAAQGMDKNVLREQIKAVNDEAATERKTGNAQKSLIARLDKDLADGRIQGDDYSSLVRWGISKIYQDEGRDLSRPEVRADIEQTVRKSVIAAHQRTFAVLGVANGTGATLKDDHYANIPTQDIAKEIEPTMKRVVEASVAKVEAALTIQYKLDNNIPPGGYLNDETKQMLHKTADDQTRAYLKETQDKPLPDAIKYIVSKADELTAKAWEGKGHIAAAQLNSALYAHANELIEKGTLKFEDREAYANTRMEAALKEANGDPVKIVAKAERIAHGEDPDKPQPAPAAPEPKVEADGKKQNGTDVPEGMGDTKLKPAGAATPGTVTYKDQDGNPVKVTEKDDHKIAWDKDGKTHAKVGTIVTATLDDGKGGKPRQAYEVKQADGVMVPQTPAGNGQDIAAAR